VQAHDVGSVGSPGVSVRQPSLLHPRRLSSHQTHDPATSGHSSTSVSSRPLQAFSTTRLAAGPPVLSQTSRVTEDTPATHSAVRR
jgi:hypothetical protein